MPKVTKNYRLESSTVEIIKSVADSEFDGNATAAIEAMVNQASKMKAIDMRHRHMMYDRVKSEYMNGTDIRKLIDGLDI